jgi:hypothetical protein
MRWLDGPRVLSLPWFWPHPAIIEWVVVNVRFSPVETPAPFSATTRKWYVVSGSSLPTRTLTGTDAEHPITSVTGRAIEPYASVVPYSNLTLAGPPVTETVALSTASLRPTDEAATVVATGGEGICDAFTSATENPPPAATNVDDCPLSTPRAASDTGTSLVCVLPSPSSDDTLDPQAKTAPADVTASEWESPAAIETAFRPVNPVTTETAAGTFRETVRPSPS